MSKLTENPILSHLIKIWYEMHKCIGQRFGLSLKSPLKQNQLIPLTVNNKILETWNQNGIRILEDCFEKGSLMTFEQLKGKYNLSNKTFFCYLQLLSFLSSRKNTVLPNLTELEKLLHNGELCKFISKVYSVLIKTKYNLT